MLTLTLPNPLKALFWCVCVHFVCENDKFIFTEEWRHVSAWFQTTCVDVGMLFMWTCPWFGAVCECTTATQGWLCSQGSVCCGLKVADAGCYTVSTWDISNLATLVHSCRQTQCVWIIHVWGATSLWDSHHLAGRPQGRLPPSVAITSIWQPGQLKVILHLFWNIFLTCLTFVDSEWHSMCYWICVLDKLVSLYAKFCSDIMM